MTVLTIIGWLFLVGLGGYFTLAGIILCIVSLGFSGRASWEVIPSMIGIAILCLAVYLSPFTVSLRH